MSRTRLPDYSALTDVGRHREENEDCHAVVPLADGLLCIVADGMGGHAAGEVASRIAVDTLAAVAPLLNADDAAPALAAAGRQAHEAIREAALDGKHGMGCTLTVAVVRPGRVDLLHVGDSRAYRVSGEGIEQVTEDDSLVGAMLRGQSLTREQARRHPARSVLTRALGVGAEIEFSAGSLAPLPGDVLLLCSDGLTEHLDDDELLAIVRAEPDLDLAAQRLVAAANAAGGTDNITVVLVRCPAEA
jgi:protein phosphatase